MENSEQNGNTCVAASSNNIRRISDSPRQRVEPGDIDARLNEEKVQEELNQNILQLLINRTNDEFEKIYTHINNRQFYILFEPELNCNPLTDHKMPKSILPILKPFLVGLLNSELEFYDTKIPVIVEESICKIIDAQCKERLKIENDVSALQQELEEYQVQDKIEEDIITSLQESLINERTMRIREVEHLREQLHSKNRYSTLFSPDFEDSEYEAATVQFPDIIPELQSYSNNTANQYLRQKDEAVYREIKNEERTMQEGLKQLEAERINLSIENKQLDEKREELELRLKEYEALSIQENDQLIEQSQKLKELGDEKQELVNKNSELLLMLEENNTNYNAFITYDEKIQSLEAELEEARQNYESSETENAVMERILQSEEESVDKYDSQDVIISDAKQEERSDDAQKNSTEINEIVVKEKETSAIRVPPKNKCTETEGEEQRAKYQTISSIIEEEYVLNERLREKLLNGILNGKQANAKVAIDSDAENMLLAPQELKTQQYWQENQLREYEDGNLSYKEFRASEECIAHEKNAMFERQSFPPNDYRISNEDITHREVSAQEQRLQNDRERCFYRVDSVSTILNPQEQKKSFYRQSASISHENVELIDKPKLVEYDDSPVSNMLCAADDWANEECESNILEASSNNQFEALGESGGTKRDSANAQNEMGDNACLNAANENSNSLISDLLNTLDSNSQLEVVINPNLHRNQRETQLQMELTALLFTQESISTIDEGSEENQNRTLEELQEELEEQISLISGPNLSNISCILKSGVISDELILLDQIVDSDDEEAPEQLDDVSEMLRERQSAIEEIISRIENGNIVAQRKEFNEYNAAQQEAKISNEMLKYVIGDFKIDSLRQKDQEQVFNFDFEEVLQSAPLDPEFKQAISEYIYSPITILEVLQNYKRLDNNEKCVVESLYLPSEYAELESGMLSRELAEMIFLFLTNEKLEVILGSNQPLDKYEEMEQQLQSSMDSPKVHAYKFASNIKKILVGQSRSYIFKSAVINELFCQPAVDLIYQQKQLEELVEPLKQFMNKISPSFISFEAPGNLYSQLYRVLQLSQKLTDTSPDEVIISVLEVLCNPAITQQMLPHIDKQYQHQVAQYSSKLYEAMSLAALYNSAVYNTMKNGVISQQDLRYMQHLLFKWENIEKINAITGKPKARILQALYNPQAYQRMNKNDIIRMASVFYNKTIAELIIPTRYEQYLNTSYADANFCNLSPDNEVSDSYVFSLQNRKKDNKIVINEFRTRNNRSASYENIESNYGKNYQPPLSNPLYKNGLRIRYIRKQEKAAIKQNDLLDLYGLLKVESITARIIPQAPSGGNIGINEMTAQGSITQAQELLKQIGEGYVPPGKLLIEPE